MSLSAICPRLPKAPPTPATTPPEVGNPPLCAPKMVGADDLSMDGLLLRRKDNHESLRRSKSLLSARERDLQFKDLRLDIRGPIGPDKEKSIRELFGEAKKAGHLYGMRNPAVDHFQMNFITRREWRNVLFERDMTRADKFPATGIFSFCASWTRFVARQWHAFTTPISLEPTPDGRIYVVMDNFFKQSAADQHQLLAEAMIKGMQQANFPLFFRKQQDNRDYLQAMPTEDPRPYSCSQAFAKMHVELCLDAMPKTEAALVARSFWPMWLIRKRPRQAPVMSPLQHDLKKIPAFGTWCAKLFATPLFIRVLLQNGGKVEIPAQTVSENKELLAALVGHNPGVPPEFVDLSAKTRA